VVARRANFVHTPPPRHDARPQTHPANRRRPASPRKPEHHLWKKNPGPYSNLRGGKDEGGAGEGGGLKTLEKKKKQKKHCWLCLVGERLLRKGEKQVTLTDKVKLPKRMSPPNWRERKGPAPRGKRRGGVLCPGG